MYTNVCIKTVRSVTVTTFSEDGLSAIATKLGTPLMLDSYTFDMCIQSSGMPSYARAMIEFRADIELKDNIVAVMPKVTWRAIIVVIFVLNMSGNLLDVPVTSQTPRGILVGPKMGFKPTKQVYQHVSKKPTTNASVNKNKNVEPAKKVSKSTPFEVLISVENDVELGTNGGTSNLASQATNSSRSSFYSEDEVALVDNEIANFLAKKDGYDTQSLLEQWTESYENDDYRYDPYDDDMYEGQDIPDKLRAICDKLDITVRVRRKK
nr:hypothetical protein [Tanacetum cinerariifolium]